MNKIECPFEIKANGDKGQFEGYAAVFNNVDLGNDVIEAGAFKKARTTKDGKIRIAMNHDLSKLAGKSDFSQDENGLHVRGQLNMNVSYVKDAFHLMKDGTLDGLSVGFDILDEGSRVENGIRYIYKADLWEYSIVPFGMNQEALVTQVKAATGIEDVRAFERFLRESGYTRKQALAIATGGFKALQSDSSDTGLSDSDFRIAIQGFKI